MNRKTPVELTNMCKVYDGQGMCLLKKNLYTIQKDQSFLVTMLRIINPLLIP